jgi:hypothetical protein
MKDTKYVMVPVVPTDEMQLAAAQLGYTAHVYLRVYKAMIAAAPEQKWVDAELYRLLAESKLQEVKDFRNAVLEEGIAALQSFASQIEDVGIRTGAMCSVDQLCSLKSQPAQPSDTQLLDYLESIRGSDIYILCSEGPGVRESIKAAMYGKEGI